MKRPYRQKLEDRARRLAERPESGRQRRLEFEVAIVSLGEEVVGIPVDLLREIVRTPQTTPLPGLPPQIRGIAQIRSELISIIDLGQLLGWGPAKEVGLLVVVERDGQCLGLAVDGLSELRSIYEDELGKDFEDQSRSRSGLLRGTTRDLLPILGTNRIFEDSRVALNDPEASEVAPQNDDPTS